MAERLRKSMRMDEWTAGATIRAYIHTLSVYGASAGDCVLEKQVL